MLKKPILKESKSQFHSFIKDKTEKECFEIFQKQIDALKPLREILWNYYNLHKMTGLP